jgi:hypothetical protein
MKDKKLRKKTQNYKVENQLIKEIHSYMENKTGDFI